MEKQMVDIFEAMMLVCFGISWPISLFKNIVVHSAKNMSLKFVMLIIVGYLFGISAKLLKGQFNYVLVIYILNLLVVFANVFVYFHNKYLDIIHIRKKRHNLWAARKWWHWIGELFDIAKERI